MKKREKTLWMQALQNHADAYRRLGMMYLEKGMFKKNQDLARLCLERSMEMGDEESYFLYHKIFSKGQKVIDDHSYQTMWREYQMGTDEKEKKRLRQYLELGTRKQKKKIKKMKKRQSVYGVWLLAFFLSVFLGIQVNAERYSYEDGSEFEGTIIDGKRQGYGVQYGAGENKLGGYIEKGVFSKQVQIKGFWYEDILQGPGIIVDEENGMIFEGFFNDGEIDGACVLRTQDKGVMIADNYQDGFVVSLDKDGKIQEALLYEGRGEETKKILLENWSDEDGTEYYAESPSEFIGGKGIAVYKDAGLYIGEFLHGEREGRGISYELTGHWYTGNWKEGKRTGVGAYYYPQDQQDLMICVTGISAEDETVNLIGGSVEYTMDGSRIISLNGVSKENLMLHIDREGNIEVWEIDSNQNAINLDGERWVGGDGIEYVGNRKGSVIDGYGVSISPEEVYIGNFTDGKKEGRGYLYQLHLNNCYDGEWSGGEKNGTGVEYMIESYYYEGTFENGKSQEGTSYWIDGSWFQEWFEGNKKKGTMVITLENGSRTSVVLEDGEQIVDENGNVGVRIYKDAAYTGFSVVFEPGEYHMEDLVKRGISKDCITSIEVPSGYKIIVYHNDGCEGIRHPYLENIDFADTKEEDHTRWNDSITSFVVERAEQKD